MEPTNKQRRELVERLTREATEKGMIIELGFLGYLERVIPSNAPEIQILESRKAFFAGAKHLLASIMSTLDPEAEPTEGDLRRMQRIHDELEAFVAAELKPDYLKKRPIFRP